MGPNKDNRDDEKISDCFGINVFYTDNTNGAGDFIKTDFLFHFECKLKEINCKNVLEWGCGPGFLGFSIFSKNLCKNLYLSDLHQPAIELVQKTIDINNLQNVYPILSNNFNNIESTLKFDCIIASPPKFLFQTYIHEKKWPYDESRLYLDQNWKIRENFYRDAKKYLSENGTIIIVESIWGSHPSMFHEMLDQNNLKITGDIWSNAQAYDAGRPIYYLTVSHK